MTSEQPLLVVNAGSTSVKFALFRRDRATPGTVNQSAVNQSTVNQSIVNQGARNPGAVIELARGRIAPLAGRGSASFITGTASRPLSPPTHEHALTALLQWAAEFSATPLCGVAHRVVHGGADFLRPQRISQEHLAPLRALTPLAPLHQEHNVRAIEVLLNTPHPLPQIACFDTAFHSTLSRTEQLYPLPRALYDSGIRRWGFHGLSYESIVSFFPHLPVPQPVSRVIVAHLGGGSSMCAVLNGESVATTMGFTPLDGLPMGTRSGSLDPGILLYLLEERGYTTAALRELLYHRSGLLGLSTCSGEMTELLRSNDPHAQEAIDYYCSRCAREIAALGTTLGGIDAVVFTGGIGEHQPEIRRAILERCHWLGAAIDDEANNTNALSFASPQSAFALCTVKTDEERVIATHAFAVLDELSH